MPGCGGSGGGGRGGGGSGGSGAGVRVRQHVRRSSIRGAPCGYSCFPNQTAYAFDYSPRRCDHKQPRIRGALHEPLRTKCTEGFLKPLHSKQDSAELTGSRRQSALTAGRMMNLGASRPVCRAVGSPAGRSVRPMPHATTAAPSGLLRLGSTAWERGSEYSTSSFALRCRNEAIGLEYRPLRRTIR